MMTDPPNRVTVTLADGARYVATSRLVPARVVAQYAVEMADKPWEGLDIFEMEMIVANAPEKIWVVAAYRTDWPTTHNDIATTLDEAINDWIEANQAQLPGIGSCAEKVEG